MKNRNTYACVFYCVDCYWLIFLIFLPQICTQTQFDVIQTQTRLGFVIVKIYPPVFFFILETLFVTDLYYSKGFMVSPAFQLEIFNSLLMIVSSMIYVDHAFKIVLSFHHNPSCLQFNLYNSWIFSKKCRYLDLN